MGKSARAGNNCLIEWYSITREQSIAFAVVKSSVGFDWQATITQFL
jgi:hypothetical protein